MKKPALELVEQHQNLEAELKALEQQRIDVTDIKVELDFNDFDHHQENLV